MHKILIPLITLGLFSCLAAFSYGRYQPQYHPTKLVWSNHNAALLAEAYGLAPDDVGQPITFWEKR